jgi:hypothetical protein
MPTLRCGCEAGEAERGLAVLRSRHHDVQKNIGHGSEQDRPDAAAERAAWKASQPEIDIRQLVFIDESVLQNNGGSST